MAMSLADIRREYLGEPLSEVHSDPNPMRQFSLWFEQVRHTEPDPTAMALATASIAGRPSVRMVLLKAIDDRGYIFYTNYESRKAREMEATGRASLLFFWRSVERQVRIDGAVERISPVESDAYFETRPLDSRWSVYASKQSEPIENREVLEEAFERVKRTYADGPVPRPGWWGGYRVVPDEFEFWQGRTSRLHDRLRYLKQPDGTWRRERLAP
jgi:pyridoxamine 5'-phosphate oxidase